MNANETIHNDQSYHIFSKKYRESFCFKSTLFGCAKTNLGLTFCVVFSTNFQNCCLFMFDTKVHFHQTFFISLLFMKLII